jgi:cytoskeletal protein CcmA (bactofilin family)
MMVENSGFRPMSERVDTLGGRRGGRESLIDNECFFEGTFRTPGNLRIEGTYQGVVECRGTLTIAETGRVNARILAGSLIVAGQLTGEAQCENRFEIVRTGQVNGAMYAATVVIHDGAFFEGEIRMGGAQLGDATTSSATASAAGLRGAAETPRSEPAAAPALPGTPPTASGVAPTQPVRRRPSTDSDREDATPAPDAAAAGGDGLTRAESSEPAAGEPELAAANAEPASPPRVNGRGQNPARNTLPGRGAEA